MKLYSGLISFISIDLNYFQDIEMYIDDAEKQQEEEFTHPPFPTIQLKFQNPTTSKYSCKTLVIGFSGSSSLFVSSVLPSATVSNRINFSKAKQTSLADVFQDKPASIVFITFNDQPQKMKEIYFAEFIQSNFDFKQIILLTSFAKNNLNQVTSDCLRSISNSFWTEKQICLKFTEGVMGMPADILSFGELKNIPVVCYVGIVGQYELSRQNVEQIFGSLRGKHGLDHSLDISDKIKKYNMKKYSNKIYL